MTCNFGGVGYVTAVVAWEKVYSDSLEQSGKGSDVGIFGRMCVAVSFFLDRCLRLRYPMMIC